MDIPDLLKKKKSASAFFASDSFDFLIDTLSTYTYIKTGNMISPLEIQKNQGKIKWYAFICLFWAHTGTYYFSN